MRKETKICSFNKIELNIPRLKLLKLLFKRSYLDFEETVFLKGLYWKTEAAENKIAHIKSIVEKALLKAGGSRA
jgi:hypothetical protein